MLAWVVSTFVAICRQWMKLFRESISQLWGVVKGAIGAIYQKEGAALIELMLGMRGARGWDED